MNGASGNQADPSSGACEMFSKHIYNTVSIQQSPEILTRDLISLANNFQLSDIIFAIPIPKNQPAILDFPHPDLNLNSNEYAYALNMHTSQLKDPEKVTVLSAGALSRLLTTHSQLRLDIQGDEYLLVPAVKSVLAARSTVFRSLLFARFQEGNQMRTIIERQLAEHSTALNSVFHDANASLGSSSDSKTTEDAEEPTPVLTAEESPPPPPPLDDTTVAGTTPVLPPPLPPRLPPLAAMTDSDRDSDDQDSDGSLDTDGDSEAEHGTDEAVATVLPLDGVLVNNPAADMDADIQHSPVGPIPLFPLNQNTNLPTHLTRSRTDSPLTLAALTTTTTTTTTTIAGTPLATPTVDAQDENTNTPLEEADTLNVINPLLLSPKKERFPLKDSMGLRRDPTTSAKELTISVARENERLRSSGFYIAQAHASHPTGFVLPGGVSASPSMRPTPPSSTFYRPVMVMTSTLFGASPSDAHAIPPASFQQLIAFLMTGTASLLSGSVHSLVGLIRLATLLNIPTLLSLALEFFEASLNTFTVYETIAHTELLTPHVFQKCLEFIDDNAIYILESPYFPYYPFSIVATIIQRSSFKAIEELPVFEAVLRWCRSTIERGAFVLSFPNMTISVHEYGEMRHFLRHFDIYQQLERDQKLHEQLSVHADLFGDFSTPIGIKSHQQPPRKIVDALLDRPSEPQNECSLLDLTAWEQSIQEQSEDSLSALMSMNDILDSRIGSEMVDKMRHRRELLTAPDESIVSAIKAQLNELYTNAVKQYHGQEEYPRLAAAAEPDAPHVCYLDETKTVTEDFQHTEQTSLSLSRPPLQNVLGQVFSPLDSAAADEPVAKLVPVSHVSTNIAAIPPQRASQGVLTEADLDNVSIILRDVIAPSLTGYGTAMGSNTPHSVSATPVITQQQPLEQQPNGHVQAASFPLLPPATHDRTSANLFATNPYLHIQMQNPHHQQQLYFGNIPGQPTGVAPPPSTALAAAEVPPANLGIDPLMQPNRDLMLTMNPQAYEQALFDSHCAQYQVLYQNALNEFFTHISPFIITPPSNLDMLPQDASEEAHQMLYQQIRDYQCYYLDSIVGSILTRYTQDLYQLLFRSQQHMNPPGLVAHGLLEHDAMDQPDAAPQPMYTTPGFEQLQQAYYQQMPLQQQHHLQQQYPGYHDAMHMHPVQNHLMPMQMANPVQMGQTAPHPHPDVQLINMDQHLTAFTQFTDAMANNIHNNNMGAQQILPPLNTAVQPPVDDGNQTQQTTAGPHKRRRGGGRQGDSRIDETQNHRDTRGRSSRRQSLDITSASGSAPSTRSTQNRRGRASTSAIEMQLSQSNVSSRRVTRSQTISSGAPSASSALSDTDTIRRSSSSQLPRAASQQIDTTHMRQTRSMLRNSRGNSNSSDDEFESESDTDDGSQGQDDHTHDSEDDSDNIVSVHQVQLNQRVRHGEDDGDDDGGDDDDDDNDNDDDTDNNAEHIISDGSSSENSDDIAAATADNDDDTDHAEFSEDSNDGHAYEIHNALTVSTGSDNSDREHDSDNGSDEEDNAHVDQEEDHEIQFQHSRPRITGDQFGHNNVGEFHQIVQLTNEATDDIMTIDPAQADLQNLEYHQLSAQQPPSSSVFLQGHLVNPKLLSSNPFEGASVNPTSSLLAMEPGVTVIQYPLGNVVPADRDFNHFYHSIPIPASATSTPSLSAEANPCAMPQSTSSPSTSPSTPLSASPSTPPSTSPSALPALELSTPPSTPPPPPSTPPPSKALPVSPGFSPLSSPSSIHKKAATLPPVHSYCPTQPPEITHPKVYSLGNRPHYTIKLSELFGLISPLRLLALIATPLLASIRFPLISSTVLFHEIRPLGLVSEDILLKSIAYQANPTSGNHELPPYMLTPRSALFTFFTTGTPSEAWELRKFDLEFVNKGTDETSLTVDQPILRRKNDQREIVFNIQINEIKDDAVQRKGFYGIGITDSRLFLPKEAITSKRNATLYYSNGWLSSFGNTVDKTGEVAPFGDGDRIGFRLSFKTSSIQFLLNNQPSGPLLRLEPSMCVENACIYPVIRLRPKSRATIV